MILSKPFRSSRQREIRNNIFYKSKRLLSFVFLKISTIFSTSESLNVSAPLIQIYINQSRLDSLRDVLSGVPIWFITENPCAGRGITSDFLNNAAMFRNCFSEPSAAKYL